MNGPPTMDFGSGTYEVQNALLAALRFALTNMHTYTVASYPGSFMRGREAGLPRPRIKETW